MKVSLANQQITIMAPRPKVFQLFSSFGEKRPLPNLQDSNVPGLEEGAVVVERDGNRLVVEFHSRDGKKLYRT